MRAHTRSWRYDDETDRIVGLSEVFGNDHIENVAKPMQTLHDETKAANIRLIVAAPDLLDCIKRVAKNPEVVGALPVLLMQDIVAVLAKVEGRQ